MSAVDRLRTLTSRPGRWIPVLVFVALQPKNHQNPVPAVDWKPQVDILRNSAKYPVVIPDPVPAGWEVNYTRISTLPARVSRATPERSRSRSHSSRRSASDANPGTDMGPP